MLGDTFYTVLQVLFIVQIVCILGFGYSMDMGIKRRNTFWNKVLKHLEDHKARVEATDAEASKKKASKLL